MNRTLAIFGVLGTMIITGGGFAQEKREPPPDAFDLVFIRDTGPVFLRIHVMAGGQAVQTRFENYLKKWFDYLDTNHDGKLDAKEIAGVPKASAWARLFRNGSRSAQNQPYLTMADLGKKPKEAASFDNFLNHFRRNNVQALQIAPSFRGGQFGDQAGEALFKILDVNGDGKLTREELAAAPLRLRKYDLDDDEMISVQELIGAGAMGQNTAMVGPAMAMTKKDPVASFGLSFYPLLHRDDRERLPEILLAHYDKEDNGHLTMKECGFNAQTFARLDKDKNGTLDVEELAQWIKGPADFEFDLQLPLGEQPMSLKPRAVGVRFAQNHQQASTVACVLKLGEIEITVQGRDTASANPVNQDETYLQLFKMADTEERGYLVLADVQDPQFQSIKDFFLLIDRDRDGKVTEKELSAFTTLLDETSRCQASLTVIEQGRALFQILDANRDGRLSIHEMRNAWSRLEPLDVDKKGYITADQIARQFQVVLAPGPVQNFLNMGMIQDLQGTGGKTARVPLPAGAPEWFRKMDANGDGFVSPREFLGSRADFNRIDTNGDGLIDAEEAERFDLLTRSKKPSKLPK